MAVAPFQLWLDIANIASAVRVSGTVTVTTSSPHGLTTGAYIQLGNTTGAAGTSMVGVYPITVSNGSAFTFASSGTAGTAVVTSAFASVDLLNPPINYSSGADRSGAMVAPPGQLQMSANGDGTGSEMSFVVLQDITPSGGPWFNLIPDNARVRLCQKDTGSTPASGDIRFLGVIASLSSGLNASGQGTETTVTMADANYLLDRVGVFGKNGAARTVAGSRFTVTGTTATVTFSQEHGFVQGQPIKVGGVLQGGTAGGFTGIRRVTSVPTTKSLTYSVDSGTTNTAQRSTQVSYSRIGSANDRIGVTGRYPNLNLLDGDTITLSPSAGFTTELAALVRGVVYSGIAVQRTGANTLTVLLHAPYTGVWPTFSGYGTLNATGYVSDVNTGGQLIVTIPGGSTEDDAVTNLLGITNAFHDTDYSLQRTFNTSGTAGIVGGTATRNGDAIQFPSTNLRSALDTVVETYMGDGKERRYFIGLDGSLNYLLIDPSSRPTYATAPYTVTTDAGAGNPNVASGTAKSTVAPFSLSVNWDHETTKNVMVTIPALSGAPVTSVFEYDDLVDPDGSALFATRSGPKFDDVVDYPTGVRNPAAQVQRAATAFLTERHKPMLSGEFTLRGAGTVAHNQFGFSSGYAQTGVSSYALVERWQPGQWVEVNSVGLGLSGLYRVEQVEWTLEPSSYMQNISVKFNRKNPSDLANLIASQTK
jgi:hypothetical protein